MRRNFDYIVFCLLLVFTTFEYFFRDVSFFWGLSSVAGIVFIYRKQRFTNINVILLITVLSFCFVSQYLVIDAYKVTSIVGRSIGVFGAYFIANIIAKRFIKIFVDVIYWISILSLVIYTLTTINAEIKDFLIYRVAPYFTSLNVENAAQTGGGVNIVIYNFQVVSIKEDIGFMQNAGPFWEPGMYAVFLSIALFLNLFIGKSRNKYCNLILSISLITTFSAGGYCAGAFLLFTYTLYQKKIYVKALSLSILLYSLFLMLDTNFVGIKISEQINSAEVGNDLSRFSAILTQIKMIEANPIIGGEEIKKYIIGEGKTLASGFLLVFIRFGLPIGALFYYMFMKSMKKMAISYGSSPKQGLLFFALLIILSISQTIFDQEIFLTLLFIGLIRKKELYGRI